MSHNAAARPNGSHIIELRTGQPYANLIRNQLRFSNVLAEHFAADQSDIIPTPGTTGGIEAVRNHVLRISPRSAPVVLTVCPGYWRARESFEGFGFEVIAHHTEPFEFSLDELVFASTAARAKPDLIYLSLPNNPTGAIFDPLKIVRGAPDECAILFDLTLPSRRLDSKELTATIYREFKGRRNLFLAGSTSKSHQTAEYRVGWIVCANACDSADLRKENRNVVASVAINEAIQRLKTGPTTLGLMEESFGLLKQAERADRFSMIRPRQMVETGYVLIKSRIDQETLRAVLGAKNIRVMWGSEFGLADQYLRLETLEPANIKVFVDAISTVSNPCPDAVEEVL